MKYEHERILQTLLRRSSWESVRKITASIRRRSEMEEKNAVVITWSSQVTAVAAHRINVISTRQSEEGERGHL